MMEIFDKEKKIEKMMIDDFIDHVKEQFDCDILVKPSDVPDTFSGVFGANFLANGSENGI